MLQCFAMNWTVYVVMGNVERQGAAEWRSKEYIARLQVLLLLELL